MPYVSKQAQDDARKNFRAATFSLFLEKGNLTIPYSIRVAVDFSLSACLSATMASRLLLRRPLMHNLPLSRSFRAATPLRDAAIAPAPAPVRKPVGAFRGGWVLGNPCIPSISSHVQAIRVSTGSGHRRGRHLLLRAR